MLLKELKKKKKNEEGEMTIPFDKVKVFGDLNNSSEFRGIP